MATYRNPVYHRACPDPFVLKYCGEYWAYCTGFWPDGRCFGILHSPDLVAWEALGGALAPFPDGSDCYWAPEVLYDNGLFYMYYSVGNEEYMQIRVAIATHPAGPFVDSGRRLTTEQFAIDAHPFEDDDGRRYLFYATDFLTHRYIGTGTVVDELFDLLTLAGRPRPVARARYDWQVYDPQRASKGGVRWHTVEGSFVLKRKGRYYHMFSGGNWQNITYGVSYATADSLATPEEWAQVSDGERVLPVIRTVPGEVIGPGHNSVVRGPDTQQLFCVYHRWAGDTSARVLSIDRLDWAGDRLLVVGPSTTPQPAPNPPTIAGFGSDGGSGLGPGWQGVSGTWTVQAGAAQQTAASGLAAAVLTVPAPAFVLEVSPRAVVVGAARPAYAGASYGVGLTDARGPLLHCRLPVTGEAAVVAVATAAGWEEHPVALRSGFDSTMNHLLRLEVDGRRVRLQIDGPAARWQGLLPAEPAALALETDGAPAVFRGFELTVGWEDLFEEAGADLAELGWEAATGDWRLADRQLWGAAAGGGTAAIAKGPLLEAYELVVNVRLAEAAGDAAYGFYPVLAADGTGPLLRVKRHGAGWALVLAEGDAAGGLELPDGFEPAVYQQFRFSKEGRRLAVTWEVTALGGFEVPAGPARVGLWVQGAAAAFDMVRVTALASTEY